MKPPVAPFKKKSKLCLPLKAKSQNLISGYTLFA